MRTSSAAFATAIAGTETEPATQVTVAWPTGFAVPAAYNDLSAAVESWSGAFDVTTDSSSESRMVTGYPTRTATLVLAGYVGTPVSEAKTAQWLMDPYSSSSPLFGLDWTGITGPIVTISQGLNVVGANAPELFTQFTGYVDTVLVDRATGQVTLTLLDPRAALTIPPALPMILAAYSPALYQNVSPGLNATYLVDRLARDCGIYSSPPPRTGCVWYESLHGSLYPEVGALHSDAYSTMGGYTWAASGRWGAPCATAFSVKQPLATPNTVMQTGLGWTMAVEASFWVDPAYNQPLTGGDVVFDVAADDNQGSTIAGTLGIVGVGNGAGQVNVYADIGWRVATPTTAASRLLAGTVGTGWHDALIQFTLTATNTLTVNAWIDGVRVLTNSTVTLNSAAYTPSATLYAHGYATGGTGGACRMDTWEISTGETSPAPSHHPFTGGQVALDLSLNNLTATPTPQGSDVWAVLQEIALAEYATCGFDEYAVLYYRTRLNAQSSSQVTVTSLAHIDTLQASVKESARALTVQAVAHPVGARAAAIVWSLASVVSVAPYATVTLVATLQQPTALVPPDFVVIPGGGLTTFAHNGYRASKTASGTGASITNLSVSAVQLDQLTVAVTIYNPNTYTAYMVNPSTFTGSPAGMPTINLVGVQVGPLGAVDASGNYTGNQTVSSIYGSGNPAITLTDSVFRQDPVQLQTLTDAVLSDMVHPRPQFDQFRILGDPRLQLGDRIRVQEQGSQADGGFGPGAAMDTDVYVLNIHPTRDSQGGFVQDLSVRVVGLPRQWVLGQAGKSELAATTWI